MSDTQEVTNPEPALLHPCAGSVKLSPCPSSWRCRMAGPNPFKWRQFQPEIILLCVRWHLQYALSYRHLEELLIDRSLGVDHTTIYR